jgi:glutamine---fructose-6-phosphate transaminase (isomerizing)
MCGIFGILGDDAPVKIKETLCRLSYRGYDSAGYCVLKDSFEYRKCVGHPENLNVNNKDFSVGIGHNRWATHGAPTEKNAHPHFSNNGNICVVHNGIIENFYDLKNNLLKKGYTFYSETDTEIVPNLIQFLMEGGLDFEESISNLSSHIDGAYALVIMNSENPDNIYAVRYGSSMYIGKSEDSMYVCSDSASMPFDTQKILQMEDSTFAKISRRKIDIFNFDGTKHTKRFKKHESSEENYHLSDFPNYMKKEIFEQSIYSKNAVRGRVIPSKNIIKLSGISSIEKELINAEEIIITGCGSALYAGELGASFMSDLLDKRVSAISAGELKYSNIRSGKNKVVIAISQSGETADTLGCIKIMKNKGYTTCGIVNTPNSTIAREVDAGIYIRAGKEISVASTKAVLNQILSLLSISVYLANKKDLSQEKYAEYIKLIYDIPKYVEEVVYRFSEIEFIAKKYKNFENMLFLSRGITLSVAKEASLKVKEISYIHAEAMSASELKHGPIALISEKMPSVFFVENNSYYKKIRSNVMEVKSRGGKVLVVTTENLRDDFSEICDDLFLIKYTGDKYFDSIKYLIFSQIFAYHLCLLNGYSVDMPRNLAKSVTVE